MDERKYSLVIGGGAFATSLADILANNFKNVFMKLRSEDVYSDLLVQKNSIYLPGKTVSKRVIPIMKWDELPSDFWPNCHIIVSGLPAAALKEYYTENQDIIKKGLSEKALLVSLSKGIDPESLELPDDILFDIFRDYKDQISFLSGPSFATEIMDRQITLVGLAGRSRAHLETMSEMIGTPYFKLFPSYDVKGLLLGGALKNVLAIAGGIIEGLGHNHNTRAALITRGIGEMLRFGVVFNARPETFYGLSGMGDLILTATGGPSRNRAFGLEVAKGRPVQEIISSQRSVIEGVKTTMAAEKLAERYQIRARIFRGLYQVLFKEESPKNAIQALMNTPARFEG